MTSNRRRIGLLGGSFNPPHAGHVHISRAAMRMLKLDEVWWLISPGNPLKPNPPPPAIQRLAWCEDIAKGDHFIHPTTIEEQFGTRYTIDTIRALKYACPDTDFVWICGSDIAHEFHKWREWQRLLKTLPFICFARNAPVRGNHIRMMPPARQRVLDMPEAVDLTRPVWYWVMNGPRHGASSTAIRERND